MRVRACSCTRDRDSDWKVGGKGSRGPATPAAKPRPHPCGEAGEKGATPAWTASGRATPSLRQPTQANRLILIVAGVSS